MLAQQFENASSDSAKNFTASNVVIIGKEEDPKEKKGTPKKAGEAKFKFRTHEKSEVLQNFAMIRLKIGSRKSIYCNLEYVADGFVYFNPCDNAQINTRLAYDVEFVPNDLSLCLGYDALKRIGSLMLSEYFRDFDIAPFSHSSRTIQGVTTQPSHPWDEWLNCLVQKFDWYNPSIAGNLEQEAAVKNIVNCKASPFPFVVFGPPG